MPTKGGPNGPPWAGPQKRKKWLKFGRKKKRNVTKMVLFCQSLVFVLVDVFRVLRNFSFIRYLCFKSNFSKKHKKKVKKSPLKRALIPFKGVKKRVFQIFLKLLLRAVRIQIKMSKS